jgi:hypothetical protein
VRDGSAARVGHAEGTALRVRRVVGRCVLVGSILGVPALAGPAASIPEGKGGRGPYLFAGIPWLTPADSLSGLLAVHGYKEVRGGRAKDRREFNGHLFENWTTVTALLDDRSRLIRWEIMIPAPSQADRDPYVSQRAIYDDAVTEMESKYGARRYFMDQLRFPYEKGDGRTARALGEGLATIQSEWAGRGGDRLTVALDKRVSVVLVYESPQWAATEKERRRKKARDL